MTLLAEYALFFIYVGSAFLVAVISFLWGSHSKVMGAGALMASIIFSNILYKLVMLKAVTLHQLILGYALMDLALAALFIYIFLNSNILNRNRWAAFVAAIHIIMFALDMAGAYSADFAHSGFYRLYLNILLVAVMIICIIGFTPKSRMEAFGILKLKWLYFKSDFFEKTRYFTLRSIRDPMPPKKRTASPKEIDFFIGAKIREARIRKGLSREELAKAMGVSTAQIQKYESGANRVTASGLFAMAQFFDEDIKFFYEGIDVSGSKWAVQN